MSVAYLEQLEELVRRAITSTIENGYPINPDLMREAIEMLDQDADIEQHCRDANDPVGDVRRILEEATIS